MVMEIVAGASVAFSLYTLWPEVVTSSARRASRASRYADAMRGFGRAVQFIPTWNRLARAKMLLNASLAALDAGLPSQAVVWAEQVIALESRFPILTLLAHSAAARGFADMGEPWEAERHLSAARDEAELYGGRVGSIQAISVGLLAQAAEVHRRQGDLRRAIDEATRAGESGLAAQRDATLVLADCAVAQGRFDDALRLFDAARSGSAFQDDRAESRFQGLVALRTAMTLTDAHRPDEVVSFLDFAYQIFSGDARLRLWCDTCALRLRAFSGDASAIRSNADALKAAIGSLLEDRVTRLLLWSALAETALCVGEFEQALEFYAGEEASQPDPLSESRRFYGIGLCRRARGDTAGARSAFKLANSRQLETLHGSLARAALEEMDAADSAGN